MYFSSWGNVLCRKDACFKQFPLLILSRIYIRLKFVLYILSIYFLQLPVPMFLPVTMDSAERIVETIQEIKEKIPSDPFEAELILMAEMVAEQEKDDKQETLKQKVVAKETERQEAPAPDGMRNVYDCFSLCKNTLSVFIITKFYIHIRWMNSSLVFILQTTSVTIVTTWIQTTWPVSSTTGRTLRLMQVWSHPVDRTPTRSSTR